jgi:hypothetical protein
MKKNVVALVLVSICCVFVLSVSAKDTDNPNVSIKDTVKPKSNSTLPIVDKLSTEVTVPPWKTARRILQECYKSSWADVDVKVSGGYETRYSADGEPISGPVGTAVVTVPLLSKNDKLTKQTNTDGRIEHLADLYSEIEIQIANIQILSELAATMRSTMMDSGQSGIMEYFKSMQEIALADSKKNLAERKIKSILDNCGWNGKGE